MCGKHADSNNVDAVAAEQRGVAKVGLARSQGCRLPRAHRCLANMKNEERISPTRSELGTSTVPCGPQVSQSDGTAC